MIPTMILIGLAMGLLPRPWYLVGLGVATVLWPAFLLAFGVIDLDETAIIAGAAALALQNTVIGLIISKGLLRLLTTVRRRSER